MSAHNHLTGKIAGILNPRELAINLGSLVGIKVDMVFRILGESELYDPDTSEKLGTVQYEKGRVKVVEVKEKFAIVRTFQTYEVNIGGLGTGLGNLFGSVTSASAGFFAPSQWVTRVQTLKYEKTDLELPEREDETSIYVKVGDVVELVEPGS